MKIEFIVELEGTEEPLELAADARDMREWEMWAMKQRPTLPMRPGGTDDTAFPMTLWLTRLSFTSAVRAGRFDGSWDDWQGKLIGIETTDEDDSTEDPTQLSPTAG